MRTGGCQFLFGVGPQVTVNLRHASPIRIFHKTGIGPAAIDARRRRKESETRAGARGNRREHARNPQLARDFDGVHRPCAAGCDHRELARIVAVFGDVDARRAAMFSLTMSMDAPRDFRGRHLELARRAAQARLARGRRRSFISPPRKLSGVEIAEQRDRRRSPSVRCRPVHSRPGRGRSPRFAGRR